MTQQILDKNYQPADIEKRWYSTWEKNNHFKPSGKGSPYCIMIPPPNVTGSLHMGHAFESTIMDTLIRYHRMDGNNTLWQVGTDHAGIATQMIVERQLAKDNTTRQDIGRDAFVERVWQWKETSGNTISQQLRRMGSSVDWTRERFTMDAELSRSVIEVFVRLYDEGLIYRGKRLVNWDPVLHTAISDLEVIKNEEAGFLWYINYPLRDGNGHLTVATTRPETLFGDVAVAIHPEDVRYQKWIGQTVQLPLTDRCIPIIADNHVDKDFGTGCLKITPAHDFNDYAIGARHDLPVINIFTSDAHLNDNVPSQFQGLDRVPAREAVLRALRDQQLLAKTEPHTLTIPRGDRSGAIIEPYLTEQWYVNVGPLAKPAIAAVENGDIQFVPENWANTYFAWMHHLEDWCISRQLWWGHRIPAWYDNDGNIYVGHDLASVRKKYQLDDDVPLKQDEDVLDTWFSSALWPFSTLGWPQDNKDLKTFYPTNVLVTGFDIIFFWVARMIMFGLKLTDQIPFKKVYIHGLIRDVHGQKMSKSKGNIIDPLDLIDGISLKALLAKRTNTLMQPHLEASIIKETKAQFPHGIPSFGCDALRFSFCTLATPSRDIPFDLGRVEAGRNFCNKLWNAARYVLMNTAQEHAEWGDAAIAHSLADRWIVTRLQQTLEQVEQAIKTYRFDLFAKAAHDFIWHEYCDWYLELVKPTLLAKNSNKALLRGTRQMLIDVLEASLRMLHPIIPFITEEIWQQLGSLSSCQGTTIMTAPYPHTDPALIDADALAQVDWLKQVIVGIRTIRAEMNINPSKTIPLLVKNASAQDIQWLNANKVYLTTLAKIDAITILSPAESPPPSATTLVADMELLIPLAGLIDKSAETARLEKELKKIITDITRCEKKLVNPNYIEKAPDDIVEKEKTRLTELQNKEGRLQEKLDQLKKL